MKRFQGFLAALLLVAAGPAARAADPVPMKHDPKQAFDETDGNKDGVIDPPEFYERVTESFYFGDVDKSGTLEQGEYEAVVVIEKNFSSVDGNGDGKITMIEFFRSRGEVFDQVDTNEDGTLSEEEVVNGFQGGARPAGGSQ